MTSQTEGSVLIVDDQKNWREALQHLLEGQYSVQVVSNYNDAERAIAESSFDVVVLDVRLVDQDVFNVAGLALLDKIKQFDPKTGVVVLTGYPDSVRSEIMEEYKADEFMFKAPEGGKFDILNFKAAIRRLVMKHRA